MLESKQNRKNRTVKPAAKISENPQVGDKTFLTTNPGDKIIWSQSIEEKSKQLAVDAPDITGDHIKVPTYFIVEYPDGEKKALHHVRDAKEISDVIRVAQFEQEQVGDQSHRARHSSNLSIPILILVLFLLSIPILIGVF